MQLKTSSKVVWGAIALPIVLLAVIFFVVRIGYNLYEAETRITQVIKNQTYRHRCFAEDTIAINDILLIIQSNYEIPEDRVRLLFDAWKCAVSHIVIYGPWNTTTATQLRRHGLPVLTTFESNLNFGSGVWSYRALLHAISTFRQQKYKGYMFLSDDLVVRNTSIQTLSRDSIWFPTHSSMTLVEPWNSQNHSWCWFNSKNIGVGSMQRILSSNEHIRNGLRVCTGSEHAWYINKGQSDFIYIPASAAKSFLNVVGVFSANKLFLEIALPTYVNCFAPTHIKLETLSLCTFWEQERNSLTHYMKHCNASHALVHPIKLFTRKHYEYMKSVMYS